MIRLVHYFIFLIGFFVYSQNYDNDFYYNTREKVVELIKTKNDSSKIIIHQLINSKNNNYKSFGYFLSSCEYYIDEDLEKFNKNINKSYALLKNKKDPISQKITCYNLNVHGIVYGYNRQNDKAIYKFNEAKKIAKSTNDLLFLTIINTNIAKIYEVIGKTDKAIEVSYENLKLINNPRIASKKSTDGLANFYSNFGSYYNTLYYETKKKNYLDSGLVYFRKAIQFDILEKNPMIRLDIGQLLIFKNKFEDAKTCFQQAERIATKNKTLLPLAYAVSDLADIEYQMKNYKESLKYCAKVDSIYKLNKADNIEDYIYSNFIQSEIYKKSGNSAKQNFHYKIYSEKTKNYDLKKIEDSERINMILKFIAKEEEYQKKIDQSKKSFFTTKKIIFLLVA